MSAAENKAQRARRRQMMFALLPSNFKAQLAKLLSKLETDSQSAPEDAAEILGGCFALIAQHVDVQDVASDKHAFVSLVLLTLYFDHRGNWAAMRGDLT